MTAAQSGVDQRGERIRRVRAGVADVAALHREECAVGSRRDLDVADDLLRVEARGERLVAVLDPLHRPAETLRRDRDQVVLGPEMQLQAEGAADVRARSPAAASR